MGYGPTSNKKGADIQCDHDARFVREQLVSFVGNKVGTKGKGQRKPFACSLRRGGPISKALVHRGVIGMLSSMITGCMDKVVQRSVYISRELSLLR